MDCRTYQLTNIKPLKGQALVELQQPPDLSHGGIVIPQAAKDRPVEAIVRKLGEPDPKRPFEFGIGDRVIVGLYRGTVTTQAPRVFKLVKGTDVFARFE